MDQLPNQQQLAELRAFHKPFCLSIYVPPIDSGDTSNPSRIELKHLLRSAEMELRTAGLKPKAVAQTLEPARQLLEDQEFWPRRQTTLALFIHPDLFRFYHIPDPTLPYLLTIEQGFNLDPLLKTLNANQAYLVLSLGHVDVQLYKGDRYRLGLVNLKDLPHDMETALRIDEYPNWRELHEIAPPYLGKGSEGYHSQYDASKVDKTMLTEFFRLIDHRLHSYLQRQAKPLILAGVSYLLPLYRKVNTYPHLWPKSLSGSYRRTELDTLRAKACQLLVQPDSLQ